MNTKTITGLFVTGIKMMQWKLLLILLLNIMVASLTAQTHSKKDSLQQKISSAIEDTGKVWACYSYGEIFESSQPDSAAFYYQKGKQLAEKLNFKRGTAAFGRGIKT